MNVVTKTKLDKMLEYPGARSAFKRLVKGGADPGRLGNLLMLRKIFGDIQEHKHWLPARRSVNSVSAKMRALAAQMQELLRFPGIFGETFPTITVDQRIDIRFSPDRLHEILMLYAEILDGTSSKKRPKNAAAGRNRSLCRLAEYIRTATGKKNYADLATLLNAVDSEATTRDPRWHTTTLGQLLYRERRRSRTPI